jgi:hypothetical protein
MQTFLHHGSNFALCATTLDYRRSGKQRVEGLQILRTLTGISSGWCNHPAVQMWEGYEECLAHYTLEMCHDWVVNRKYKDTCAQQVRDMFPNLPPLHMVATPLWIDDVVESHRSNLIRKFPEHYGPMWPTTPDNLPYVWPTKG